MQENSQDGQSDGHASEGVELNLPVGQDQDQLVMSLLIQLQQLQSENRQRKQDMTIMSQVISDRDSSQRVDQEQDVPQSRQTDEALANLDPVSPNNETQTQGIDDMQKMF